jgi:hypothetical protein
MMAVMVTREGIDTFKSASKQNGSLHAQRVLILSHSLEAKKRAHSPELAGSREEHGTTGSDAAKDHILVSYHCSNYY